MFDLSKEKIDVKCDCGRKHVATLQDAINRKVIGCSCGTNIQLNDDKGSVKKGVSDINNAFRDLENTIKRLGR
jgi:hypothetical protein